MSRALVSSSTLCDSAVERLHFSYNCKSFLSTEDCEKFPPYDGRAKKEHIVHSADNWNAPKICKQCIQGPADEESNKVRVLGPKGIPDCEV